MNFFKKLFGKTESTSPEENQSIASSLIVANSITTEQSLLPIIKAGKAPLAKIITPDGKEFEIPESSLPVSQQIENLDLSVLIGIDKGDSYEWLQNKHILSSKEEVINRAYKNLLAGQQISIGQIDDEGLGAQSIVGVLTNTNGLASSYILIDQVWKAIFKFCNSMDIRFIIPSQDKFLFCSSGDLSGCGFLTMMCEVLYNNDPKPLTNELFRKRDGQPIEKL